MLSLIVTFFDETAYLRTALRSIRNQRLESLDLIVVNDNPEVFSEGALAELTKGFDARVIHHRKNRGLSAARNTGIAAAHGDFVGFLDADDYFTVGGLRKLYEYARETEADITHGACLLGHAGSASTSALTRDSKLHMTRRVVNGRMVAQEAQFIVSSWSSLYRADFLEQKQLWFDVEQRKFEDRLFVLNAVTAAEKIAFLGEPVRVWRQRANSISSAKTTPETHLLQLQLLEKCLAHMKEQAIELRLPARFVRRELFNCVSRLIWDMDLVEQLAKDTPGYGDMGQRIQTMLGRDSFGHAVFDDPMVKATSRVGMKTRRGKITRTDFFILHKALREGQFRAAQAILDRLKPGTEPIAARAKNPQKRLVLHIGLHKTGSTFIQHHLLQHRNALKQKGILVPETGFETAVAGRPGALSGHQGLLRALRQGDGQTWKDLRQEIERSTARTILISAENLAFPTEPERDDLIRRFFEQVGQFGQTDVVALLREPDAYVEAFHAEWVVSAHPSGCRSIEEFLVDQAENLTNLPTLFEPFETLIGRRVMLGDFDAMRQNSDPWQGFCELAGLPRDLPTLEVPRYPTPDRESVILLQLLNLCVADQEKRRLLMDTYFGDRPQNHPRQRILSPQARVDLIQRFMAASAEFAAERGVSPDLDELACRIGQVNWTAPEAIPVEQLQALLDVGAQVAAESQTGGAIMPAKLPVSNKYEVKIRLRPWVVRLLKRIGI